ncbi:MAG: hypothetical protein FH749_14395 [Firmicutes bacterium]|nr:hypothetical protein [Bacillota bacterium]
MFKRYVGFLVVTVILMALLFAAVLLMGPPRSVLESSVHELQLEVVGDMPVFSSPTGETDTDSSLTFANTTDQALQFFLQAQVEAGELALFDLLTIEVSSGESGYYYGPLSRLHGIPLGELAADEVRELELEVSLPAADKEFDDQVVAVSFEITGQGDTIPLTQANIDWLLIPGLALTGSGLILYLLNKDFI